MLLLDFGVLMGARRATWGPAALPHAANSSFEQSRVTLIGQPEQWPEVDESAQGVPAVDDETFNLYVILDIDSRYVPGWMLARAENATLAKVLLETIQKDGIERHRLTLHSDRGARIKAKPFAQ